MKKVKKIFKYETGDMIPEGAIYLQTITQNRIIESHKIQGTYMGEKCEEAIVIREEIPCWFVWHYFLVEVEE